MKTKSELLSIYYRLKKKQHLKDLLDYDPKFLEELDEENLTYLIAFLCDHYEGPGERDYRATRYNMTQDAFSQGQKVEDLELFENIIANNRG